MKLSPEERKERIKEYQREYYERNRGDRPRRILFPNLTEEERKERKERKREDNKRYRQNMTEEQKEKLKEYDKRYRQNRTEEQKEERREYYKRRYQNMMVS